MIMITVTGKRTRTPKKKTRKVTKPFRPPRRGSTSSSVIPGLLYQTNNEKKVLYTAVAAVDLSSTGNINCLNLIRVGSSMFNRIGRKIEMRSIRIRANMITLPVTRATATPSFGRMAVVYDRQTNGAFPSIADIFQDTDQAGANTDSALSGINMDNRERFVTIIQKNLVIPQATATAGVLTNVFPNASNVEVVFDEFRKLRGLTTHYKADSAPAVIGDISTGALYLIGDSTGPASGSELFGISANVRLKYVDV